MQFLPALIFLVLVTAAPVRAQSAAAAPTPAPENPPAATPTPTPPAAAAASPTPQPATPPATGDDVIALPANNSPSATPGKPIVSESEMKDASKPIPTPDSAFVDPNGVVPGSAAPGGAPAGGESAEEQLRKTKIRYKEVRTQVEKDPEVVELLNKSKKAKSYEEERAALREYYRTLFKKMKKVDKSITERCNAMENAYIARLSQYRIEPTIPLNPPPKPEVLGTGN